MHRFFKSEFFNFEVVRILGTAPNGGSDVAEVLEAIGHIKDGDAESWGRAWKTQAERAEALGIKAKRDGLKTLARDAFLRASNYTRASGYMLTGDGPNRPDPNLRHVCERVHDLFREATALMNCGVHYVSIPYSHGKAAVNSGSSDAHMLLPGILYLPPPEKRAPGKIPILISTGGADALQEELYYMHPCAGPDLGYAVLTFEGPGQGLTLRRENVKMRPDWEVVVSAVVDWIEEHAKTQPELNLDTSRIAIAGASLGGYFALRGALDPRIKACAALDPTYSLWDFAMAHVSPAFVGAWDRGWLTDGFVDFFIGLGMKAAFQMRWDVSLAGTFFGIESPAGIMKEMKRYSFEDGGGKGSLLERLECPVLVSGASHSLYFDADHHTLRVHKALTALNESDKELWIATTPGQGSIQAKMGALNLANLKVYGFLDRCLGVERGTGATV